MSYTSFTNFLPGDDNRDMDRYNTNRKRPAPTYNDFNAVKRRQAENNNSVQNNNTDSLFLSDDEGNAEHDTRPVQRDNAEDFTSIINASRPQPRASVATTSASKHSGSVSVNGGRTGNTNRSPASNGNASKTSNSSPAVKPSARDSDNTSEVKDELEDAVEPDHFRNLPASERVRIYIGRANKQVFVKRSQLAKSHVLTSYITDDPSDSGQSSYIMRPQLLKISFEDFQAVLQYLHSGEYEPLLVDGQPGEGQVWDTAGGVQWYAKHLVRAGRIYCLAQMFVINGLADVVYNKITQVDRKSFSIRSLVELARVVFTDNRAKLPTLQTIPATTNDQVKDKLEEWIIGQIAQNFEEITRSQHESIWSVVRMTSKKMFFARVLEEVADRYRATGGKLPGPIVELD